mmetsp:Transcript_14495/g.57796  ORF Transcript_14495/g.57796 Transcript_14495/m.57796 type:complete len:241 (-) Transcript_14495:441-1163(-)
MMMTTIKVRRSRLQRVDAERAERLDEALDGAMDARRVEALGPPDLGRRRRVEKQRARVGVGRVQNERRAERIGEDARVQRLLQIDRRGQHRDAARQRFGRGRPRAVRHEARDARMREQLRQRQVPVVVEHGSEPRRLGRFEVVGEIAEGRVEDPAVRDAPHDLPRPPAASQPVEQRARAERRRRGVFVGANRDDDDDALRRPIVVVVVVQEPRVRRGLGVLGVVRGCGLGVEAPRQEVGA